MKDNKPNLTWEGRAVRVVYIPDFCKSVQMAHIEVHCNEPLPITETGYKSHFIHKETIGQYDSAIDFVQQWLDHEAKKTSWTKSDAASPQLSLF